MGKLSEQVTETNRLLHNIASVGVVSAVNAAAGKMRLKIGDNETDWVTIPSIACGELKIWRCPTVGEQFAVLSESGNLGNAIALIALSSDDYPHPSNNPNEIVVQFPSGSFVINQSSGHATITLEQLNFIVPKVNFSGEVHADKEISSDMDVKAGSISLKLHKHGQVQSGLGTSGGPQ